MSKNSSSTVNTAQTTTAPVAHGTVATAVSHTTVSNSHQPTSLEQSNSTGTNVHYHQQQYVTQQGYASNTTDFSQYNPYMSTQMYSSSFLSQEGSQSLQNLIGTSQPATTPYVDYGAQPPSQVYTQAHHASHGNTVSSSYNYSQTGYGQQQSYHQGYGEQGAYQQSSYPNASAHSYPATHGYQYPPGYPPMQQSYQTQQPSGAGHYQQVSSYNYPPPPPPPPPKPGYNQAQKYTAAPAAPTNPNLRPVHIQQTSTPSTSLGQTATGLAVVRITGRR